MINTTINITSVGVQRTNAYIPTLGSEGPQWGKIKPMCPYIYLSPCIVI